MGFSTQNIDRTPSINLSAMIKGSFVALCSTLLLSMFTGLLLSFTSLSEANLPGLALGILTLGAVGGGWTSSRMAKQKGLIHGFGAGVIFLLAALAVSAVALPTAFTLVGVVKKTLFCLFGGALGGVLGVGR
ncbi:MAG: TIGR04086 family membrane protein [Clostridia bacterium]|nr:TIGR04086 family membrane protein [Clostridia bacterium]